ncbi:MAG: VOC family protein [Bdellovibrionaceae bacterium]|nr:VOC family protein [Pseudobdellovibrionaceae bacterium]
MIKGLNHITLSTSDLEKSFAFYKNLLNFAPLAKWRNGAYFLAGDVWFCITQVESLDPKETSNYNHIAFTVSEEDFPLIVENLNQHDVKEWKTNSSEGKSHYFLDPDGNQLEIHCTNWKKRIDATKLAPYKDMEFFV